MREAGTHTHTHPFHWIVNFYGCGPKNKDKRSKVLQSNNKLEVFYILKPQRAESPSKPTMTKGKSEVLRQVCGTGAGLPSCTTSLSHVENSLQTEHHPLTSPAPDMPGAKPSIILEEAHLANLLTILSVSFFMLNYFNYTKLSLFLKTNAELRCRLERGKHKEFSGESVRMLWLMQNNR